MEIRNKHGTSKSAPVLFRALNTVIRYHNFQHMILHHQDCVSVTRKNEHWIWEHTREEELICDGDVQLERKIFRILDNHCQGLQELSKISAIYYTMISCDIYLYILQVCIVSISALILNQEMTISKAS